MGTVLDYILHPPGFAMWLTVPVGLGLIWWDSRHQAARAKAKTIGHPVPKGRNPIQKPLTFRQLFETDFPESTGLGFNVTLRNQTNNIDINIPTRILINYASNTKFMAILIPKSLDPLHVANWVIANPSSFSRQFDENLDISGKAVGDATSITTGTMGYANIIYFYTQKDLSSEEKYHIEENAKSRNLIAQIRDHTYFMIYRNDTRYPSPIAELPDIVPIASDAASSASTTPMTNPLDLPFTGLPTASPLVPAPPAPQAKKSRRTSP